MHNEVLEDGRQSKLDLTRLIKSFTLDLVIEYNLEVCASHCVNRLEGQRGETEAQAEQDAESWSGAQCWRIWLACLTRPAPKASGNTSRSQEASPGLIQAKGCFLLEEKGKGWAERGRARAPIRLLCR